MHGAEAHEHAAKKAEEAFVLGKVNEGDFWKSLGGAFCREIDVVTTESVPEK